MKRPEGFDRPSPPPPKKPGRPALRPGSSRRENPEEVDRRVRPVADRPGTRPADRGADRSTAEASSTGAPVANSAAGEDVTTQPVPIVGASPVRRLTAALPGLRARAESGLSSLREAPRRRTASPTSTRVAEAEVRRAARRRRKAERLEMRRFTRRSRNRRIAWLSFTGVTVVLTALIVTAVFSPLLALRTIIVDGTSRLNPFELEQAVSGQLGTPLALLDEQQMTDELARFTLIRSYVTEIVPPHTLVIHVVERTPVGAIESGDGVALVDPAGVTIETLPERPEGVPMIDLRDGDVGDVGFASMAEVLSALPADLLGQVDSIAATTRDDVTLSLVGGAQDVVWGSAARSERKAQVLAILLAANGNAPGEYDVSAPGSPVFRGN